MAVPKSSLSALVDGQTYVANEGEGEYTADVISYSQKMPSGLYTLTYQSSLKPSGGTPYFQFYVNGIGSNDGKDLDSMLINFLQLDTLLESKRIAFHLLHVKSATQSFAPKATDSIKVKYAEIKDMGQYSMPNPITGGTSKIKAIVVQGTISQITLYERDRYGDFVDKGQVMQIKDIAFTLRFVSVEMY